MAGGKNPEKTQVGAEDPAKQVLGPYKGNNKRNKQPGPEKTMTRAEAQVPSTVLVVTPGLPPIKLTSSDFTMLALIEKEGSLPGVSLFSRRVGWALAAGPRGGAFLGAGVLLRPCRGPSVGA